MWFDPIFRGADEVWKKRVRSMSLERGNEHDSQARIKYAWEEENAELRQLCPLYSCVLSEIFPPEYFNKDRDINELKIIAVKQLI